MSNLQDINESLEYLPSEEDRETYEKSTQPDYPLTAYTERDSIDPQTCEEGKLRQEWTVVVTPDPLPDNLRSYGRDWDEFMLLRRYVRRGTIEPWDLMGFYATKHAALLDIDPKVIPVDPHLMTIHREHEWARRVEQAKRAAESDAARAREAECTRRTAGSKAFEKLQRTGKPADVALCTRWNDFTSDPANIARRDLYAADPAFMERYHAALYANRLPTKRKAIQEFFAYVEVHYT